MVTELSEEACGYWVEADVFEGAGRVSAFTHSPENLSEDYLPRESVASQARLKPLCLKRANASS